MTGTRSAALSSSSHRQTWFPWSFFALIFALSAPLWLLDAFAEIELMPGLPLSALMVFSAAAAACIFAYRHGGPGAVRSLLARCVDFRRIPSPVWYVAAVLLMPGVLAASYVVMRLAGMPLPDPQIPWSAAPALLLLFLVAAACEELAWSATALEPLQWRWGALRAALVIGIVGALWHVIPFVQAGNTATWIAGQMLFTVVFRGVIVWLYNHAGGSVFAAIVCHATYNLAWQLFPNRGSGYNPWVTGVVTAVVLAVLVLASRVDITDRQGSGPSLEPRAR